MFKAYLHSWNQREEPDQHRTDFSFASRPEKALPFRTKQEAEAECVNLDRVGVGIESDQGQTHTCTGWAVEGLSPDEFVVFCEIPFVPSNRDESPR